mmetsp:Transcript_75926/g.214854  ORF Transcript_75926/g.214854 Transcript_75926/m.214854 type:complete len:207 (-) Transcript_75926:327-947(-)
MRLHPHQFLGTLLELPLSGTRGLASLVEPLVALLQLPVAFHELLVQCLHLFDALLESGVPNHELAVLRLQLPARQEPRGRCPQKVSCKLQPQHHDGSLDPDGDNHVRVLYDGRPTHQTKDFRGAGLPEPDRSCIRPHPSCSPLARTPPMFDAELDTGWWQRAFVPSMHLQGAPSLKCATEAECRPLPQTCGERAELRTLILEVGNL